MTDSDLPQDPRDLRVALRGRCLPRTFSGRLLAAAAASTKNSMTVRINSL